MNEKLIIRQDTEGGGFVTIPVGGTPVIKSSVEDLGPYAPAVVNFLRCGCPLVQIYSPFGTSPGSLEEVLKVLQLEGENFLLDCNFPVFTIRREYYIIV